MSEQNSKSNDSIGEGPSPLPDPYLEFGKAGKLETLAWYLVVFGFIFLGLAGLCFYLRRINYRDFTLNGMLLGNYLLLLGISLYVGGRAIKYYRRFKQKGAR